MPIETPSEKESHIARLMQKLANETKDDQVLTKAEGKLREISSSEEREDQLYEIFFNAKREAFANDSRLVAELYEQNSNT